jgi:hypothetical protein
MKNLSLWIFKLMVSLLLVFIVLFFIFPGSVLEVYIPNYIYFVSIPLMLVLVDLFFNKNLNKKYFYLSIFIILIFIILKFVLEYWFNNSFNIMNFG